MTAHRSRPVRPIPARSPRRAAASVPSGRPPFARLAARLFARPSLVVLAVLALAAGACGGGEPEPGTTPGSDRPPVEAAVAVATVEPAASTVTVTGSVEPSRRARPGTKILGRVAAVPVDLGDRVGAGQVLLRLESRDLAARLEQAEAAVAMAGARLDNARSQHRRMVALHERGSVTDKNLEDAVAGLRVAEAGLEQARADATAARVLLEDAVVTSPFAGFVTERRVEVGDMVQPGMALFTVEDLDPVEVVADVPEARLASVVPDTSAVVRVPAAGLRTEAPVETLVPSGDRRSRTFRIELPLANPDGLLRSGQFARVDLAVEGARPQLRVPATAVVERGQLDGLFVVEEASAEDDTGPRARLRWVRLGETLPGDGVASSADAVEVLSGLAPGERYLVDPPPGLEDGDRIRPVEPAPVRPEPAAVDAEDAEDAEDNAPTRGE